MPDSYIRVSGTFTPEAGDPVPFTKNVECDADQRTEVTVEAGESDLEVIVSGAVLPADAVGLMIEADTYPATVPGTPDLSFKVGADTNTEIPLSGPMFIDGALFAALGAAGIAPDKLFFTNAHASTDAKVTVHVAYNVL